MKTKTIPLRSCVVSKEKLPKQELIRVVKNKENEVFIDLTGKANGKGAYIKKDLTILEKAIKTKALEKQKKKKIENNIYEELKNIINK